MKLNENYFSSILDMMQQEINTIYKCNIMLIHDLFDRECISQEMYHNIVEVPLVDLSAQVTTYFQDDCNEQITHLVLVVPLEKEHETVELLEAYFQTFIVGVNKFIYVPTDAIETLFFRAKKLIN